MLTIESHLAAVERQLRLHRAVIVKDSKDERRCLTPGRVLFFLTW